MFFLLTVNISSAIFKMAARTQLYPVQPTGAILGRQKGPLLGIAPF